jgi:hypothetical protein
MMSVDFVLDRHDVEKLEVVKEDAAVAEIEEGGCILPILSR